MSVLGDKTGRANIRHVILTFIILSGLAAAFLYYPPIPTRTAEELTRGDITFTDVSGNPISGAIGISGSGISGGYKENVNFIKWERIPNGIIYFDALGIKNVSVKFRLGGDSQNANVIIENYGAQLPKALDEPAPGIPIKYVQVSTLNLSFVEAEISIKYNASELGDIDENSLNVYHYDRTSNAWNILKTKIDAKDDILTASVDSLSIFALSAKLPGQIDVLDAKSRHVRSDIKTYNDARDLKKSGRSSTFVAQDIPLGGELEVDAITSKNVALRLKVNAATGGEIILDDYGRKNPVSVPLPGRPVKFVEIGVQGISFSSAQVSVRYREAELNGVSENSLVIYHWNLTYWEALGTTVDAVNNILTASTTALSPFAISGSIGGPDRILVATNRYVVLDDPIDSAGGANASSGYALPFMGEWGNKNVWGRNQTTIGISTLYIDNNGKALSGRIVNFTIYNPNSSVVATGSNVTDPSGLAHFYKDMDNMSFYGVWKVKAESDGVSSNTTFIYNWWGCAWATGGQCSGQHSGKSPADMGGAAANSPYTMSWERTTSATAAHNIDIHLNGWTDDYCTVCHQSYDGNPTTSNVEGSAAKDFYVNDVHSNISCTNSACHDPNGTSAWNNHNTGSMTIGSCDNCHDRTDISRKSTLDGTVSSYSNSSGTSDKYHTPNATVPCIICHGPMHNISKPYPAAVSQNNITEDTQCAGCHSGFSLHNNSVNCTFCHSSDVHFITVFGGATYVYTSSPEKGDCTTCHQNSSFMDAMKNVPKAGNYSGRNAPQVPVSVVHSEDSINGSKWNITEPYWTNTSQIERCKYCHGETMHKTSALGRPSLFSGGNPVNGTISTSLTWCQQCHWQGSQDYAIMAATFIEDNRTVPPEITGNATFGIVTASDGTIYVNHSSYAKDDSKCWSCHGALSGNDSLTGFMHSAAKGNAGGVNCTSCHNTGGIANNVNFSAIAFGMHAFLNNGAVSSPENASNIPCWACHGTKNGAWANESDQPVGEHNTSIYNNPRKCENCHNDTTALFGAGNVTDHIPSGISPFTDVNTSYYRLTYCSYCHNNSIIYGNDVSMGISGGSPVNASVSHYGVNRTAGRLMSPSNNSTDCVYCHRNSSNMLKWGITQGSRANISNKNASGGGTDHSAFTSSSNCPACHGNYVITGSFTFHNSAIGSGTISASSGGSDCVSCHDIGGAAASEINVTAMKQGNHKDLNRNATNATPLDTINKACWACHGYGEDTGGHSQNNSNPGDYTNPWKCVDCHSRYPNFTSPNLTIRNEITGRKVIDHIQKSHAESIYSDAYNPAVNCTTCHDKSKVNFTDSVTPTDPAAANVSHYSDYSSLIVPSKNCSLCHQSPANAAQWYANLTRHPAKDQNYTFCANCHNSTNIVTFHSQPLVWTPTIHGFQGNRAFDWENDDASGGATGALPENDESCAACHSGVLDRICENCHMPNSTSLFTGPFNPGGVIRDDINDTLPYVYSHINYSTITGTGVDVPNQNNPGYPTSCYYYNTGTNAGTCHGNSYYNMTPAGGYYAFRGLSSVKNLSDPAHRTKSIDRMPDTTNCLFCHAQPSASIRYAWGSPFQVNASNMFGNRYSVSSNQSCYLCHTSDSAQPKDFHSLTVVTGGGPGCLGCHNTSTPQNYSGMHYIDGGNFSRSTHANLNSNNASGFGINASCWACHNSTGTVVPENTHPDRKITPFICIDCHLTNGSRAGAYNATIISNHFRNGTAIRALDNRTSDIASCIECHENVSGMLLPNNDNDTGSFAGDTISVTGGRTSTYHYGEAQLNFGKTKGSSDYCSYCHRNVTGEFKVTFTSSSNSSISNHSSRYNASTPSCSLGQCHNSTGNTLHGNNLSKPDTGYNSSYCLNCHGLNTSSGTANFSGITTGTKTKHNNSINCEKCHMNDGRDIHPVKYLQPGGIFNTSNSTAVNCVLCHLTGVSGFSNAPMIPSMHHSDNNNTGSIWNLTSAYWTNTSQQSMCDYCHGDTRHNEIALGRPANWSGLNVINSTITNNSNWCAGCHYQGYSSGSANYNTMVQKFEKDNLSVPPEITNLSSYAPYSKNGYFNHTLTPDYTDSTCKGCHGVFLPNGTRMDGFMHNISTGSGTCTGCHFSYSYMSITGVAERYVNQSMYNSSAHGSLACEDCHTKGHKNIAARKACEDCHSYQQAPITDRDRHNITGTPAQNVVNNTVCTSCHDSGLLTNATSQYGYGKTYDCNYCHTYPDKTYS